MDESKSQAGLFSILSLALFIAGLLVPFLIAAIGGLALGVGFGIVAEALALVFGILGWTHRPAKVAVIGIIVLFLLAGVKCAFRGRLVSADCKISPASAPLTPDGE